MAVRLLHYLVNDEPRVASDIKALDAELNCYVEPVHKGLILCHVVRGWKVDSDHVTHSYFERGDEDKARASPHFHQRSIKVHGPTFRLDLGWRELGPGPLSHEIHKDMGVYCLLRLVHDSITHKFHSPFGYPTIGLLVLDHLP